MLGKICNQWVGSSSLSVGTNTKKHPCNGVFFCIGMMVKKRTSDPLGAGRINKNNLKMLFLFIRAKFAYKQASISDARRITANE